MAEDCCTELLGFWTHLARHICSGRQLGETLRAYETEAPEGRVAEATRALRVDVEGGMALSDAMKRQPDMFAKHVTCLVEGGERAGVLDRVLPLILELAWRCPTCILRTSPPEPGAH